MPYNFLLLFSAEPEYAMKIDILFLQEFFLKRIFKTVLFYKNKQLKFRFITFFYYFVKSLLGY